MTADAGADGTPAVGAPPTASGRRGAEDRSFAISAAGVVLVALSMRQAVAGVPPVLGDLGLGPDGAALLVAIPALAFSVGALAGPALRARFGDERTVFGAVALVLGGMLVRALWPDRGLFPGTVVAGLAIAVLNVLLPGLVKRRFPERIGAMMAANTTTMTLGAALAAGLTVPVLRGAGGSVSVALGIWVVPAALALAAWLPQLRSSAPAIGAGAATGRRGAIWRRPLAWSVLLFMGMQSLLYYGPLSWLPQIYRDRGEDAAYAGFLLMTFNLCGIVGNLVAPVLAARMPDQRPAVAAAIVLVTVGLLGVLAAPNWTAPVWAITLGVAQGSMLSLALLLIVLRSADADTAARLSSMAQAGGYLLAATGPLAMGLLRAATGGWTAPLLFLLAVAGLIWLPGLTAARNITIGARDQRA